MGTPLLLNLLEQESGAFQRIDCKWRPQGLFLEIQTQELVKDMARRWESLKAAETELQTLDKAALLQKLVRRMGFIVKRAKFVRRANHLAFAQAVSEFYEAYGEMLRLLKIDGARGKLLPAQV